MKNLWIVTKNELKRSGDQFADMGFLIGVEAVGRFVEEQYGRIA